MLKQADGFIFYFGSEMGTGSYITGQLLDGNLVVKVYFDGKKEKFQVSNLMTVKIANNYRDALKGESEMKKLRSPAFRR